ncbi:M28 family metallopeptidase [Mycolicibacterium vaccae]|jgi:Zn-dependent M28 family amino/carboxypeptidase|uniref:Aminopeptidase Y n=1 Tax=Mycolicibacterium vaccae ATCC 25954 TaxID=1194972 RepID=K0VC78_MYCVA|nr:M28 family metallopeptidase [Mycolicibacterium vaccae]ANI37819.1 peptidase M28 [Mycolicibacterium vaccae 95051]EJZ08684.1 aminopeptidase Y [Mycolicibacterium vaccae ATCC 25954]MCV7059876.1 M20/M25/M40 family metallo-hydrolase [Mycolicibacterium vaccae]
MTSRWAVVLAAAGALVAACAPAAAPPTAPLGPDLAGKVTIDGVYRHLVELQQIADDNDGNRADGTPGYQASVDYVAQLLRDRGFDVQTPEFERLSGSQGGAPVLTVAGRDFRVDQASMMITTDPGGLRAPTFRPRRAAGCAAADYGDVSVVKAIAVVDDSGCSVVDKHRVAQQRGAVGLLVVTSATPTRPVGAPVTLFTTGYYTHLTMPVGVIDTDADAALRRTESPVTLVLDHEPVLTKSRNVIAQTRTGDDQNVVVAGAHLDSIRAGAGINDNGSGVAAVLETALQLGAEPATTNAVRFAFWGAEEVSMDGSKKYLGSLSKDELDDIAMYLNFDMLASLNAGYFTDDGDQSTQTGQIVAAPEGSAGIERTLAARLNMAGLRPADIPLQRITDYGPFLAAGIPVGGLTTGSSQRKTEVQARLWGGKAGEPFDPNYHTGRDDIDNVDRDALEVMASAAAYAIGTYAESIEGVNGVPGRDQRDRRTS